MMIKMMMLMKYFIILSFFKNSFTVMIVFC